MSPNGSFPKEKKFWEGTMLGMDKASAPQQRIVVGPGLDISKNKITYLGNSP